MGWFWNIRALPNMPHARHLAQVLAQHEFQEALKNYRDLRFLQQNLEDWRDKLGVFNDMLATRRKAFAERLPVILERQQKIGLDALTAARATTSPPRSPRAKPTATASPSPTPSSSSCCSA